MKWRHWITTWRTTWDRSNRKHPHPRRNHPRCNQPQQRRQPERPVLEDVLTQLTQEILRMRREVTANQPQQAQQADIPEDQNFNWNLLKLPAETKFPVPCTGIVQRITADLLARLPSLVARDQHDARFVLAVVSDWEDPTMRCATLRSSISTSKLLLPPTGGLRQ